MKTRVAGVEIYVHRDFQTGNTLTFNIEVARGIIARIPHEQAKLAPEVIHDLIDRKIIAPDLDHLKVLAEMAMTRPHLLTKPVIIASTKCGSILVDGTHRATIIACMLKLPVLCVLLTAAETRRCLLYGGTPKHLWDEAADATWTETEVHA